jgi:hypothetical protein
MSHRWRAGEGARGGCKDTVLTDCSELAREKMWARIHLIPALQAEEDRDQVRRYLADRAREKELLGSETKVYNSDRYGVDRKVKKLHTANVRATDSSDQYSRSHRSTRRNRESNFGLHNLFILTCTYKTERACSKRWHGWPATCNGQAMSWISHASCDLADVFLSSSTYMCRTIDITTRPIINLGQPL